MKIQKLFNFESRPSVRFAKFSLSLGLAHFRLHQPLIVVVKFWNNFESLRYFVRVVWNSSVTRRRLITTRKANSSLSFILKIEEKLRFILFSTPFRYCQSRRTVGEGNFKQIFVELGFFLTLNKIPLVFGEGGKDNWFNGIWGKLCPENQLFKLISKQCSFGGKLFKIIFRMLLEKENEKGVEVGPSRPHKLLYLAHYSHHFFMSIRIEFSASYSMLS